MFWKKRKEDNLLAGAVSCDGCLCLLLLENAQKIIKKSPSVCGGIKQDELHYCNKCRKPYSRIYFGSFYKEIEVDERGEPIGYIGLQQAVNMKVKKVQK